MIGDHWTNGWEHGEPRDGECGGYEVTATDHPTHSPLLGPDGQPLEYEPIRIGFDLTRKQTGPRPIY